jgi:DNA repair protein RadD
VINLRPYQQELIEQIRDAFSRRQRAVLAVLPTGAGKTVCFSYITEQAAARGNRVCILVHRAELLRQASASLTAMGVPHGLVAANHSMDLSRRVQIASVATLARRLHHFPQEFFQLLVVDEAHHSNAGTWAKVLGHFSSACVLGVTATPCRGDSRGLGEWYSAMVLGPSAAWLTDNGYLAQAKVYAPPIGFDARQVRTRMGDFDLNQASEQLQARQAMGDCLAHYRQHLDGQTAIAFCCSIAHAEGVAELFNSNGVAAASIDGTMDAANREQLLADLAIGRIRVLTSCALIGEGVDVPSVAGCILLRPTQSVSLHLQMIGRCLRPSGDKVAVVLDHVGNTQRLGHHLEPREWSLDGVKKRPRDAAPSIKVCPRCFCAMASQSRVCPECGHEFAPEKRELQHVPGQLQEVTRGIPRARFHEQRQAQTLEDLIAVGERRGMKNPRGWARHVMAARQLKGRW